LYTPQAMTLIQQVEVWHLNRPMSEEHVDQILQSWEEEYAETNTITIFGSIVLMKRRDDDKKVVIDGQHRFECLRRFVKTHKEMGNLKVFVEVISGDDLIQSYQKINNLKPHTERPTKTALKSIDSILLVIKKQYPNAIKDLQRTIRPLITTKQLKDTLIGYDKMTLSLEQILLYLNETNEQFREMTIQEIFGREHDTNPKGCLKILTKARDIGFFLGLRKAKSGRLNWK
jgi:hypothetical protein